MNFVCAFLLLLALAPSPTYAEGEARESLGGMSWYDDERSALREYTREEVREMMPDAPPEREGGGSGIFPL